MTTNPSPSLEPTSSRHSSNRPFEGWTALITGGSSGIGLAIAVRLIERGIRCVLVGRNQQALGRAVNALGPLASAFPADLSDRDAIERLVCHLRDKVGRLDLLIHNAAVADPTPFEVRTVDSILHDLNVNLAAPLILTHALLAQLQAAPDGRVISIASLGAIFPMAETAIYSATKFGLRGAMLGLGLDGERLGVKFGIVNPSATDTPMLVREAIEGGSKLQFTDPPQPPDEVAKQVLKMLDRPCLERHVRFGESWLVRLAMLMPNWLGHVMPLFEKRAEAGHLRYLKELEKRGAIHRKDGAWEMTSK